MNPSSSCEESGLASSARRRDVICGERDLGMRASRAEVWDGGSWWRGGRWRGLVDMLDEWIADGW